LDQLLGPVAWEIIAWTVEAGLESDGVAGHWRRSFAIAEISEQTMGCSRFAMDTL